MIYYLLPTLAFIGSLCCYQRRWSLNVSYYWVLLLLMALGVGMFRGENIGSDYQTYKFIFQTDQDTEIGVSLLMKFFREWGFHVFLAVTFLISYYLKWLAFRIESIDPFLSLTLYFGFWFLVYDLNGIRQGLALGFCGMAVVCCMKESPKWSALLWTALGICCHYSMILFLPFVFLYKCSYNIKIMLLLTVIAFVISYMTLPLKIVEMITGDAGNLLLKISNYATNEEYNSNIILSFSTIHRYCIFLVIIFIIPKTDLSQITKGVFIWGSFLCTITYLILSNVEILATRGSLYFRFIELFSLAAIPYVFYNKGLRLATKVLLYLYVIWQISLTLSIPDGNLMPFRFIFI